MAAVDVAVALWHLIFLALAIAFKRHREFGAQRIPVAELVALMQAVRRLVTRRLRGTRATRQDVEDLTQDVMLAAWQASEEGRYRPDPSVPWATARERWLGGVVFHLVEHHLGAARMRREQLVEQLPAVEHEGHNPELACAAEERRRAVMEILSQAPGIEGADIIIAHDIDEIPMAELAELLRVPVSTLYRRRALALAMLADAVRQRSG